MERIKRMIMTLFPRGLAWRLPNYWQALIDGWARAITEAKEWLAMVKQEIHPRTSTTGLCDWQKMLAIVQDDSLSQEQRQAQLEAIDVAKGGQDVGYINRILQIVYPLCWVERVPTNDILGNRNTRCGLSRCAGGEMVDADGQGQGSVRFFYYVKGDAQSNEEKGIHDLIARLCPAHMQAIWLVDFVDEEVYYARQSASRR